MKQTTTYKPRGLITQTHVFCFRFFFSINLILSSLTLFDAQIENIAAAVVFDQGAKDGEEFVRRIVHGEKITDRPEMLLFTAPFRLCENGCKNEGSNELVLSFPMYVGRKSRMKYQGMYKKDWEDIHQGRLNAPFNTRSTTTRTTTTTTTAKTTEASTIITNSSSTTNSGTSSTVSFVVPANEMVESYSPRKLKCANVKDLCWKKIKKTKPTTVKQIIGQYEDIDSEYFSDHLLDIMRRASVKK